MLLPQITVCITGYLLFGPVVWFKCKHLCNSCASIITTTRVEKQPFELIVWFTGQGPARSLTGDEGDGDGGGGSGSGGEGGKGPPEVDRMPSAEDINNMAALLAGKPADGDVRPKNTTELACFV